MKTLIKVLLIIAVSLLFIGGMFFGTGLLVAKGDFSALSFMEVKDGSYTENQDNKITSISIDFNTTDVSVEFSETATSLSIDYQETFTKNGKQVRKIVITEQSGALHVKQENVKKLGFIIGFNFTSPKVKVTIPSDRIINMNVQTDTGDVAINKTGTFDNLIISTDTGDVSLQGGEISCLNKAEFDVDTGDIMIKSLFSAKTIEMESDTGDITFYKDVKAENLTIETSTGDVETEQGLIDSNKVFIETSTGDVEIKLVGQKSDYSLSLRTSTGDKNVENTTGGQKTINVKCSTGDIEVYFEK